LTLDIIYGLSQTYLSPLREKPLGYLPQPTGLLEERSDEDPFVQQQIIRITSPTKENGTTSAPHAWVNQYQMTDDWSI
tara:strand:+ start:9372 stop:9605 length:234 start_codon:yes stop_codon:yes gene_type:complete